MLRTRTAHHPIWLAALVAAAGAALVPAAVPAAAPARGFAAVCGPVPVGEARCDASVATSGGRPLVTPSLVSGWTPADLQAAYALPSGAAGAGVTVGIVDAYDNPRAEADLAVYRRQFGLPPCTTANGCFRKLNQAGVAGNYPSRSKLWGLEISVDLDMVSAACPRCHIVLVEATSSGIGSLGRAVDTAVAHGATVVSNSYGGPESSTETTAWDPHYHHAGVAVVASTGDNGYGVQYPAASRWVTAVGGTSLSRSGGARGWDETGWGGAGSGCSRFEPKPAWQTDTGCSRRTVADVAAVADPGTGVAVYDQFSSGGWTVIGGTSVAAPIIASAHALDGGAPAGSGASRAYAHPDALNDVTGGTPNGSCPTAQSYLCKPVPGYDGPTGLGSPEGVAAF